MVWKSDLHDMAQTSVNVLCTLLKNMDMFGNIQKASDPRSRDSPDRCNMCSYTDLTTNLQHPPKQTSRYLAGNEHKGSKNENIENVHLLSESISQNNAVIYAKKGKAEAVKRVSDGVL